MDEWGNWWNKMVRIYVEGGGDDNNLRTACRQGFSSLLKCAGFAGKMPRIVACGSRSNAYTKFCNAILDNESSILLVDSESPIAQAYQQGDITHWKPWQHLKQREEDKWEKPTGATDQHCHLMVECMESWLIADKDILASHFGKNFKKNKLPQNPSQHEISKKTIYDSLSEATKDCKNGQYNKARHSFAILRKINPKRITCPWAQRFFKHLSKIGV